MFLQIEEELFAYFLYSVILKIQKRAERELDSLVDR